MALWHNAIVTNIIDETPFVKRFFLEVADVANFLFLPGQFITLDLPISDKRQKRWRSYSIASALSDNNQIELCIVKKYDGLGTKYMFEEINIGSTLTFKGPDGAFVLPKSIDQKKLVLICTGTGIAPFRSFILHVFNKKLPFIGIHLIFGARYKTDILYFDELKKLSSENKNFTFDIALSREEEAVSFHKGYVHDIYLEKYLNNTQDTLFYICGWTQMIDDAVANLIVKMGCDKSQVVYELYG